jgi:hypothetical protein
MMNGPALALNFLDMDFQLKEERHGEQSARAGVRARENINLCLGSQLFLALRDG